LTGQVPCGAPLVIAIEFEPLRRLDKPHFGITCENSLGQRVFSVATYLSPDSLPPLAGPATVYCTVPEVTLVPGSYTLSLSAGIVREHLDYLPSAVALEVLPSDFYGNGRNPTPDLGQVLVRSSWRLEP